MDREYYAIQDCCSEWSRNLVSLESTKRGFEVGFFWGVAYIYIHIHVCVCSFMSIYIYICYIYIYTHVYLPCLNTDLADWRFLCI